MCGRYSVHSTDVVRVVSAVIGLTRPFMFQLTKCCCETEMNRANTSVMRMLLNCMVCFIYLLRADITRLPVDDDNDNREL